MRRATFALTLSSGNQHLTHLQRFTVSGRLHSGTCFGDGPFWARVQTRTARQAHVQEVSLRGRLRHLLQHQGHGQPQSKSFKAELPSETASPKPPPALPTQRYLGTLGRYSVAIFSFRSSPSPAKSWTEMQGPIRPNTSLIQLACATLPSPSSSRKRPKGRTQYRNSSAPRDSERVRVSLPRPGEAGGPPLRL